MPRQVTFEVPDEIANVWDSTEVLARRAPELMVLDALRERWISTGKAAELLGISLWECHELAAQHDVPTVAMSEDELRQEFEAAEHLFDGGAR